MNAPPSPIDATKRHGSARAATTARRRDRARATPRARPRGHRRARRAGPAPRRGRGSGAQRRLRLDRRGPEPGARRPSRVEPQPRRRPRASFTTRAFSREKATVRLAAPRLGGWGRELRDGRPSPWPCHGARGDGISSIPIGRSTVTDAGLRPGDLVVDVGAGSGASRGRSSSSVPVIAVELHPRRAALRAEFGADVVVVQADAADLRLPRRDFHVVANPPFGITNASSRGSCSAAATSSSAHLLLQDWAVRRWEGPDAGRTAMASGLRRTRAEAAASVPACGAAQRACAGDQASDGASGAGRLRADFGRGHQEHGALALGMLRVVRGDDDQVTELGTEEHEARHGLRGHLDRTVERAVRRVAVDDCHRRPRPTRRLRCRRRGRRARRP